MGIVASELVAVIPKPKATGGRTGSPAGPVSPVVLVDARHGCPPSSGGEDEEEEFEGSVEGLERSPFRIPSLGVLSDSALGA